MTSWSWRISWYLTLHCWASRCRQDCLRCRLQLLSLAFIFGFSIAQKKTHIYQDWYWMDWKWPGAHLSHIFRPIDPPGSNKGINNDNTSMKLPGCQLIKLAGIISFLLFGFNAYQGVVLNPISGYLATHGDSVIAIFLLRSRATLLAFWLSGSIMLGYTILPKNPASIDTVASADTYCPRGNGIKPHPLF